MATDPTFHSAEGTLQCRSHFGWHKEDPHRSHVIMLPTNPMPIRRGPAPRCWKAKACNLTLIWCSTDSLFSSVKTTNRGCCNAKSAATRLVSSSRCPHCMCFIYGVFSRTAAVWSCAQKAHEQVRVPETDVEHHPAPFFIQKKTSSHTLGLLYSVNLGMVTGYRQKRRCKACSCSGLRHWFRHSLRDWYWSSHFWRRSERILDSNLDKKPIQGAGARYEMWKQEWMWQHKIQPP